MFDLVLFQLHGRQIKFIRWLISTVMLNSITNSKHKLNLREAQFQCQWCTKCHIRRAVFLRFVYSRRKWNHAWYRKLRKHIIPNWHHEIHPEFCFLWSQSSTTANLTLSSISLHLHQEVMTLFKIVVVVEIIKKKNSKHAVRPFWWNVNIRYLKSMLLTRWENNNLIYMNEIKVVDNLGC